MEVRSIYKYARISPFKVREVTREIQGLPVSAALDILAFTPKKAAFLINKTLKSAIANAATPNQRAPRPRGAVRCFVRGGSHIRIVLTDDVEIETRETRKAKREQEK